MHICLLRDRCLTFLRLAFEHRPKVSLVENRDTILQQLSQIKSYEGRVELAEKHFEKLGEGSSRTVFRISPELILKVAHNDKGNAQNLNEAQLDLQKPCAVSIIAHDPEGKWLIADWTETITEKEFKEYVGIGFEAFSNALFYAFNNESDAFPRPKEYDRIKKHPLFRCISEMIVDGSLLIGDEAKISSWGLKDGKVVLRDSGLSKQVYQEHYTSDSSSSSTISKTKSSS